MVLHLLDQMSKYFQTNSQPYYVVLSPKGDEMLKSPIRYTPDMSDFISFLKD